MTDPTKPAAEEALEDVLKALENTWQIEFTKKGRDAVIARCNATIGNYLTELQKKVPHRRLWSDPTLKELPEFIIGHCVAEIASAIKAATGSGKVSDLQALKAAKKFMDAPKTERHCKVIVTSYEHKLGLGQWMTPICEGKSFR